MPENVQVDAQLSMARVLRPFKNFEAVYSGQTAATPVAFFEENAESTIDQDANAPEHDSLLCRFVPVPMGSRICAWFPNVLNIDNDQDTVTEVVYRYSFHWRIRNLTDANASQQRGEGKQFHSRTLQGRADTFSGTAERRVAIPSATRSIVVETTPTGNLRANGELHRERIDVTAAISDDAALPLDPSGSLLRLQQGILDPGSFPGGQGFRANNSLFLPFWFDAEGDELLITANRADAFDGGGVWNFSGGGDDQGFSYTYGTNVGGTTQQRVPGLGIYLFTGSNP